MVLHELTPLASLEEAFMELTSGSVEFGRRDQDDQHDQPDEDDQHDPVNATQGGAR